MWDWAPPAQRRETKRSWAGSRWPGDMLHGFRLSEER